jgi:ketol-acid reductoisomerase
MAAKIYYDDDVPAQARNDLVAVVGYGSQGRSHALNLRDAGFEVSVGVRKGSASEDRARADGFDPTLVAEAVGGADLIAMMVPDQVQPDVYRSAVEPDLRDGVALLFAHGFNIHFGQIRASAGIDVVMVGPKAPGPIVRRAYEVGKGVPAVVAVEVDSSGGALKRALAYAKGIGCTRAGVIETTFAEETETDLFGEQAVLAGGVSHLIQAGFDTLVAAGYQPEIAYFECLHEMKGVVDLIYEGGFRGLRSAISDTAEYGSLTRGRQVIGEAVMDSMRNVLDGVRSGAFAREWLLESQVGLPALGAERRRQEVLMIEEVGERLRAMMPDVD